jgi:hypothetical protein
MTRRSLKDLADAFFDDGDVVSVVGVKPDELMNAVATLVDESEEARLSNGFEPLPGCRRPGGHGVHGTRPAAPTPERRRRPVNGELRPLVAGP